jgi:hypothetical protein
MLYDVVVNGGNEFLRYEEVLQLVLNLLIKTDDIQLQNQCYNLCSKLLMLVGDVGRILRTIVEMKMNACKSKARILVSNFYTISLIGSIYMSCVVISNYSTNCRNILLCHLL